MSSTKEVWTRRSLLGGAAGTGAALFAWKPWVKNRQDFSGELLGPSREVHALLARDPGQAVRTRKADIAIIGAGISGLSAARALKKRGIDDFVLLEGEDSCGGNSRSGRYQSAQFPWGAHYLPLPHPRMHELIDFLTEIQVISGLDPQSRLPIYREEYLCAEPHERLKIAGTWQDGIIPHLGLSDRERDDFKAFFAFVQQLKERKDADGRQTFEIPLDRSSLDRDIRALDSISMAAFLKDKNWSSPALSWYVEYACRDDYGLRLEQVSAWAGIHYFASRDGLAANAPASSVLTWPEGNAFLVKYLQAFVPAKQLQTQQWVTQVERKADRSWQVSTWNARAGEWESWHVKGLIMAVPRMVAAFLLKDPNASVYHQALHHSPWLTAQIALRERPLDAHLPLSWDNVLYQGEGLGYIYAGQQELSAHVQDHVLTYYRPIDHLPPAQARRELIGKGWKDLLPHVLPDMDKMHPGIRANIKQLDIWIWGHGMIGPTVGYLWGDLRRKIQKGEPNLVFAHCDGSGMSLFEEAFYQGLSAAEQIARSA